MLSRRRMLVASQRGEEEMREWKVLLDHIVTDNSITYYCADALGCKEFFVSILFANDPDFTETINGLVSLNTNGNNPWNYGIPVSGNIQNLAYNSNGNNSKGITHRFEVITGIIIPVSGYGSYNSGASRNTLTPTFAPQFPLFKDDIGMSFKEIDEVTDIAVGSYKKYFGVGSKILILGR